MMSSPSTFAAVGQPWKSSKAHKKALIKYNHAVSVLGLTRDRDPSM